MITNSQDPGLASDFMQSLGRVGKQIKAIDPKPVIPRESPLSPDPMTQLIHREIHQVAGPLFDATTALGHELDRLRREVRGINREVTAIEEIRVQPGDRELGELLVRRDPALAA